MKACIRGRPGVLVERGLFSHEFNSTQFYPRLKWYHNLPNEFRRGSIIRFSFSWFYSESLYKGRPGVLVERGPFSHEFNSTQFYPRLKWYHNLPNEFRRGSIIRFSFSWFYSESLYKGRPGVLVERGLFSHEFNSTQFYPRLKWYHNLPNEFRRGSIIRFSFSWFYSESLYKGRPGVLVEREVFYMNSILLNSTPVWNGIRTSLMNSEGGPLFGFSFSWFYSESLYKGRPGVLVERGPFSHEFNSTQFYPRLKWYHNLPNEFRRGSIIRFFLLLIL